LEPPLSALEISLATDLGWLQNMAVSVDIELPVETLVWETPLVLSADMVHMGSVEARSDHSRRYAGHYRGIEDTARFLGAVIRAA